MQDSLLESSLIHARQRVQSAACTHTQEDLCLPRQFAELLSQSNLRENEVKEVEDPTNPALCLSVLEYSEQLLNNLEKER